MSCNWIKDKDGNIMGATAPNGVKSKLFEDLEKQFGRDKAIEMYSVANSDEFQEIVPINNTGKTQSFFSDVVRGISDKFKPKKEWSPLLDYTEKEKLFDNVYSKFKGNFDTHIASSIPTFRETQVKVGAALVNMLSATPKVVNTNLVNIKNKYLRDNRLPDISPTYSKLDGDLFSRIAEYHKTVKDDRANSEMKASYRTFLDETKKQYEYLVSQGYKIEPWLGEGEPYGVDSDKVREDVINNKHLYYLRSKSATGDNNSEDTAENYIPFESTGIIINGDDVLFNDLFRAVHDIFGHGMINNTFSAQGELNAYKTHAPMYSKEAQKALFLETVVYNAWYKENKNYAPRKIYNIPQNFIEQINQKPLVYDIGGSEGGFVKAITEVSNNSINSINLDVNEDMQFYHNNTPVKGSKFIKEAFYESYTDEDTGITYEKHVPKEKADVVHESMVFQFISPERQNFIKEVKDNYIKKDGIFLLEEKLVPSTNEEWLSNEKIKDSYKLQFFTQEELKNKSEEVLVGMRQNQTAINDLKEALKSQFENVEEYWSAGNFKGFIATDDKSKLEEFFKNIGGKIETELADKQADEYLSRLKTIKEKEPQNYWSVDIPSNEEIINASKEGRIVSTEGGMAIVTADGNMIGLFKDNPEIKGVAPKLEQARIKIGGIKKDNYDGYLTKIYEKSGFKVASRLAFNTKVAPKEWNEKLHGKPDVVFMVYDPNNQLNIKEKSFNKNQYDEAVKYRESFIEEAKKIHPFYSSKNQEPTAQTVVRFISEQNENKQPLSPSQKVDLQNFVLAVGEYNISKIVDLFFDKNGLFTINSKKLLKSGYYSNYEVSKIASDVDLQDSIKESVEALKNNEEDFSILDYKVENLEKINEFNSFGKMNILNPNIVQKTLIQELGGLSKEEFDLKIQDFPYQNIDKNIFEETSQYVEAEVFTEKDGKIVPKPTEDTEVLLSQTAKLTSNQEFIYALETSNITKEYEQAVLDLLGIDITGFSDMLFDAKLVMAIQEFAKSPNKQNTEILAQEYDRVFEKDVSPKKEKIKGNKELTGHVKIENTSKTEEQLFQEENLLKVKGSTYIKVTKKPLEQLYAEVATHFKEIKNLKEYVQDKIKGSDFTNSENAESNYLYKMYFELLPVNDTDVNYTLKQIENGILQWSGDIGSPRIDLGISWVDIRKGEADLKRGKTNSVPATRLVEAIIKTKKEGGYRYKLGTGGESQRATTFVTFEDMERSTNEYGLTNLEIEELNKQQEIQNNVKENKVSSKFTGSYEYYTKDYVSDFYVDSVKEKNKNSDKWKNFYSNFGINEKGLYLINDDEISMQNITAYADEKLKQYSLVSKQLPDFTETIKTEESYSTQTRRDGAVNYPESVKQYKGEIYKLSNKELILKNTTDDFLKIGNDVFEVVEVKGQLSHYVKLDKNTSDYNIFGVKQKEAENKLEKYSHLNETPSKFVSVKKYLTKEEEGKIDEDFNC